MPLSWAGAGAATRPAQRRGRRNARPQVRRHGLLEALKSPAFYVGALGSRSNTAAREERLALLCPTPSEIDRLHGPIGLDLGSKTPVEIAVSILAEIIAVKNGVALMHKKDGSAMPPASAVCAL